MFVDVGLYGVSFILKLNMIPTQVDLSGLSAVELGNAVESCNQLSVRRKYVSYCNWIKYCASNRIDYIFNYEIGLVEKTEIRLIYFWNFWIL